MNPPQPAPRPRRSRRIPAVPPAQYCGIPSPVHAPHGYRGLHDGRVQRLLCPGARWSSS